MSHNSQGQLQEPGAGLPTLEAAFLNAFFKFGTVIMSDRSAMKLFNKESDRLLQYADEGGESYDISQELLIPRVMGIEDSRFTNSSSGKSSVSAPAQNRP